MPFPNKLYAREYMRNWRHNNPEKVREYKKKERQKDSYKLSHRKKDSLKRKMTKTLIFNALGGMKCGLCGFSDIRALQLDHIKSEYKREDARRFKNRFNIMYRYYANNLEEAKQKLQVLCANCNWIKRYQIN